MAEYTRKRFGDTFKCTLLYASISTSCADTHHTRLLASLLSKQRLWLLQSTSKAPRYICSKEGHLSNLPAFN